MFLQVTCKHRTKSLAQVRRREPTDTRSNRGPPSSSSSVLGLRVFFGSLRCPKRRVRADEGLPRGQCGSHLACLPPEAQPAASYSAPTSRGFKDPTVALFLQETAGNETLHSKISLKTSGPTSPPWATVEGQGWDPGKKKKKKKKNLFPACPSLPVRNPVPRKAFAALPAASVGLGRGWGVGEKRKVVVGSGVRALSLPRWRTGTRRGPGGRAPQPGPRAGGPRHRARPAAPRLGAAPPACPGSPPGRRRAPAA